MLKTLTQKGTNPCQKAVFDIPFHHCDKNDEMAFFANDKQKRAGRLSKLERIVRVAASQGKLPAGIDTYLSRHAGDQWLLD